MRAPLDPFSFVLISIAGWMNEHQQHVIEYLMEENRVLREQMGSHRLRFSDNQRCRLAAKAKKLGRKLPAQVATIITFFGAGHKTIHPLKKPHHQPKDCAGGRRSPQARSDLEDFSIQAVSILNDRSNT